MGRDELPAERRFLKGAAISVWQNSPDEASQWTAFARRPHNLYERILGKSKQMCIDSFPDFWNRYANRGLLTRHDGQGCPIYANIQNTLVLPWIVAAAVTVPPLLCKLLVRLGVAQVVHAAL